MAPGRSATTNRGMRTKKTNEWRVGEGGEREGGGRERGREGERKGGRGKGREKENNYGESGRQNEEEKRKYGLSG